MSAPDESPRESWHLKKEVPLALIFALAGQSVGLVWWAASVDHRLEDHGRRIVVMEATDERMKGEAATIREALGRLDERMASQLRLLQSIENTLARNAPR